MERRDVVGGVVPPPPGTASLWGNLLAVSRWTALVLGYRRGRALVGLLLRWRAARAVAEVEDTEAESNRAKELAENLKVLAQVVRGVLREARAAVPSTEIEHPPGWHPKKQHPTTTIL